MIFEMTISHINTSKNPKSGAMNFLPRDTKIIRSVPKVTSKIREQKIRIGSITHKKYGLSVILK